MAELKSGEVREQIMIHLMKSQLNHHDAFQIEELIDQFAEVKVKEFSSKQDVSGSLVTLISEVSGETILPETVYADNSKAIERFNEEQAKGKLYILHRFRIQ